MIQTKKNIIKRKKKPLTISLGVCVVMPNFGILLFKKNKKPNARQMFFFFSKNNLIMLNKPNFTLAVLWRAKKSINSTDAIYLINN